MSLLIKSNQNQLRKIAANIRRIYTTTNRTLANTNTRRRMATNTTSGGASEFAPTTKSTIAVAQMLATNDKAKNMSQVEKLVEMAKEKHANFLFLPECCDFVGEHRKETIDLAETLEGPTMYKYKELAKCNKMWLSLGGLHESITDESGNKTDKIYNAHVLVNDDGEVVSVYRKLHLFDVETATYRFRESDVVVGGDQFIAPVQTPAGLLGMQICYDVRFSEASLLLRKMGAQLLTYPSAFTYSTGKAHWEVLMRARAIENQCFVISAAQQGWHNKKRQSWGHAMIVSPWGKILADCGGEEELTVAAVEIDLSTLPPIYKSMPCFDHRRNDVYSLSNKCSAKNQEFNTDRVFAAHTIDKRTIFYESEHCYAFTNIRCVVEGHVLVASKRVMPRLSGLNIAESADMFILVLHIQRMLEAIYGTTSATVTVQDGVEAGQTVPHVHFHVMPRRIGDFGHNDEIYVRLHAHKEDEDKPLRDLQQRIDEAQKYRTFLQTNKL